MEWIKPIDQVETDIRSQGMFLLVAVNGRNLWIFGYNRDKTLLQKTLDSLVGRRSEMVNFLTARARAKGETT